MNLLDTTQAETMSTYEVMYESFSHVISHFDSLPSDVTDISHVSLKVRAIILPPIGLPSFSYPNRAHTHSSRLNQPNLNTDPSESQFGGS